jgi:hypothetical protein
VDLEVSRVVGFDIGLNCEPADEASGAREGNTLEDVRGDHCGKGDDALLPHAPKFPRVAVQKRDGTARNVRVRKDRGGEGRLVAHAIPGDQDDHQAEQVHDVHAVHESRAFFLVTGRFFLGQAGDGDAHLAAELGTLLRGVRERNGRKELVVRQVGDAPERLGKCVMAEGKNTRVQQRRGAHDAIVRNVTREGDVGDHPQGKEEGNVRGRESRRREGRQGDAGFAPHAADEDHAARAEGHQEVGNALGGGLWVSLA